ncbi:Gfo/Idh/MocA family oxidoreductase [Paenibacillus chondroitinus]|uniref:Gfo/Idh/MocA family oxidoreductase n=1 Tax=Paenibacillus chondroitinus TaxID=59842 RepID=A0ABU6D7F0_9BACL|nr:MULTISPECIES: Gfo/Idh/MocA family oxidoreductase [Paenibacillus]MCY9661599.1 Gfo/Idh/MocA family oxidoreductase [Paenibacillus anseongense]MEB4793684.1 Gfo/Idh/MocA family oxidoreductase [Paenibacillus chondroitinus]
MFKLGLMGCGVVANYGHIPSIMNSSKFELTAIYEPDVARKEELQKKHQVEVFSDVELFFQSGIDAVVITSPAPSHYQNVRDAARYGKHVLCEKPLAMDDEEAAEMIAVMEKAGLMLFTAFDYRFSPVSQMIKTIVENKSIGDVRSLRLSYIWNNHGKYVNDEQVPSPLNLRRANRMLEGGPMVDCGVHQIDLARWWLNSDVQLQHSEGAWVDEYEAPDHMYLHMKHANKVHTMLEISYSYCFTAKEPVSHFIYELIGTDGVIRYDREAKLFEMRNSSGTTRFPYASEKNFNGMYEAFALSLETGQTGDMPTGLDGLIATRIARRATNELIQKRALLQASE